MTDDIELIHSPLTQVYSADGHTLHIQIYRSEGTPWVLEIEDELGTSSVWDEQFETDKAALVAAFDAIQAEGAHTFVINAQQEAKEAEPEQLRTLAGLGRPKAPSQEQDTMGPLTDAELDELEQFLLYEVVDEGMTLDMLDGYLHAIAIGPETVMPSQWLPKVWGQEGTMMPPGDDMDRISHVLGLIMRHFNSILTGFEQTPPLVIPYWDARQTESGLFEDAESWACGFSEGIQLSRTAWQALINDPEGQRWYRPIGLLGEDDFSADQSELTRTPEQRGTLAAEIEESLTHIHAFWLPLRKAVHERKQSQRLSTKVGRNEPCPCGSGKKFKKCCGAPSELH